MNMTLRAAAIGLLFGITGCGDDDVGASGSGGSAGSAGTAGTSTEGSADSAGSDGTAEDDILARGLELTVDGVSMQFATVNTGGYVVPDNLDRALFIVVMEDQTAIPFVQLTLDSTDPDSLVAAWMARADLTDIPLGINLAFNTDDFEGVRLIGEFMDECMGSLVFNETIDVPGLPTSTDLTRYDLTFSCPAVPWDNTNDGSSGTSEVSGSFEVFISLVT